MWKYWYVVFCIKEENQKPHYFKVSQNKQVKQVKYIAENQKEFEVDEVFLCAIFVVR